MATTPSPLLPIDIPTEEQYIVQVNKTHRPIWEWCVFGAIVLFSTFLDFTNLQQVGYGNTYYATAVKSMLLSRRNFFYLAYDPGGFISVDKPPVALWLQTISAKLFGFNGVSLILPQAIAGVLSVVVLYFIVRRTWGGPAALFAAGALTISPINIVANRDNILDSILILTTLLATWAILKACDTGEIGFLLLGALLIGIGFNTKTLEAFLVVPALALTYLLGAPQSWLKRIGFLLIAGVVVAVVSLSWLTVVDLTPASQRPYVGSSTTNSEFELAFGYNGLQRLTGKTSTKEPAKNGRIQNPTITATLNPTIVGLLPKSATQVPITTTGKSSNDPGLLRYFTPQMGSQISWFLPFVIISLLAIPVTMTRGGWRGWLAWFKEGHLDSRQQSYLLWGSWLLTGYIFFSFAKFFSFYYLVIIAPAICALAGIGLVQLWLAYREGRWQAWLVPVALVGTAIEDHIILSQYNQWSTLLDTVIVTLALVITIALVVTQLLPLIRKHSFSAKLQQELHAASIGSIALVLFLSPTLWSVASLHSNSEGGHPVAVPINTDVPAAMTPTADPLLIAYLQSHVSGQQFLVATLTTATATPIIFSTGEPVMALGGFSGYDPILTTTTLSAYIQSNAVRYMLIPSTNLSAAQVKTLYPKVINVNTTYSTSLTKWISTMCAPVLPSLWSKTALNATKLNKNQLFDCGISQPTIE